MSSATMLLRIRPSTKNLLSALARNEGKTSSQVVRDLIERYVNERDIAGHVDDLWKRIGTTFMKNGFSAKDVPRIIKEVRKSR